MKRIDYIEDIKKKCTGCMACVDVCSQKCISSVEEKDGFKYSLINKEKCIGCGKCYSVCPIEKYQKQSGDQHLFAAYSIDTVGHNNGSSGGIYELLANYFLENGYYVCGAAFEGTTLKHRIINSKSDVKPLLKSKYIQSNTEGIYVEALALLKKGEKLFFCGTPCQVSAIINSTPQAIRGQLFTADIICHGVPSQKVFDSYIKTLEKKHGGKISDFSFRIKDSKYKHVHGYSYRVTRNEKSYIVNGIYTNSTFYNAFKNYLIFRDGCYDCQYTTLERVSDITLADFWGIEKYDFNCNPDSGISMVITNTDNGYDSFLNIKDKIIFKEFPLKCGVESNHCLTHRTEKPKNRDKIIQEIAQNGYEKTASKYFCSKAIYRVYWLLPTKVRNIARKIRGN